MGISFAAKSSKSSFSVFANKIIYTIFLDSAYRHQEVRREWDEWGHCDRHTYTIDTWFKIDNLMRAYCVAQGTLLMLYGGDKWKKI